MNISVIIPIKDNCAIARMIESLQKQENVDFEVIGVIDCGECEKFRIACKLDERFHVYEGNGHGAGAARNIGLSHARGKYVVFLDSDDFFDEHMLERAYIKMEEDNLDVCIWNVAEYDDVTKEYSYDTTHYRKELLPQSDVFAGIEAEHIFNLTSGAPWNKMYRRQFILDNGLLFMEQPRFNDLYFTFIAIAKAKSISTIDEVGTYYRVNNSKSLQGTKTDSIWDSFVAFDEIYNSLHEDSLWEVGNIRKSYLNYVLSCSLSLLKNTYDFQTFFKIREKIMASKILEEIGKNDLFEFHEELYKEYENLFELDACEYIFNLRRTVHEITIPCAIDTKDIYPDDYIAMKYSDYRLQEIEKSFSYRIGQGITWLPRKLKFLSNRKEQ